MALQAVRGEMTDFLAVYGRAKSVLLASLSQKLAFLSLSCYTRSIAGGKRGKPERGIVKQSSGCSIHTAKGGKRGKPERGIVSLPRFRRVSSGEN
jgi:hypothetical protein